MKKLTKKQVETLIPKLNPYWKKMRRAQTKFTEELLRIQIDMNKNLSSKLNTSLEFIQGDGEIVGIGSENWEDRVWFPLIHDTQLD